MTQAKEIAVGELVAFSSGEYSDYSIRGFSRVLKPINSEIWDAMVNASTVAPDYNPKGEPYFNESKAVAWLVANGYIEELAYTELHLGDYGDCSSWENA